jgi:hypothetical protein
MKEEDPTIRFGKYQGQRVSQVPFSYLRYVASSFDDSPVKQAAITRLGSRRTIASYPLEVTLHAQDRFSMLGEDMGMSAGIELWKAERREDEGMATFLMRIAHESVTEGRYVPQKQEGKLGKRYAYKGMTFVIEDNGMPTLLTVMLTKDQRKALREMLKAHNPKKVDLSQSDII